MSYTFNLNTSQVIDISVKMLNIIDINGAAQSTDYNYCLNILNMMLKSWSAQDGIKLWKRKQGALFLSYNQPSYQLGTVSGADNCALVTGYVSTTSTSATASG